MSFTTRVFKINRTQQKYERDVAALIDTHEGYLRQLLLYKKILLDIADSSSGKIIVPAHHTFTKSLIRKLLIARKHLKIVPSPFSVRIGEMMEALDWGLKKLEVAHQRKVSKVLSS